MAGTSHARGDFTAAPAPSTRAAGNTHDTDADSLSRLVRTSAGAVALRPVSTSSATAPFASRASDVRSAPATTRSSSDDESSLEIGRAAKIAAPTLSLGRADSIARASEAPGKIGDGSFSRQFWTAGIDKRAGTEPANAPTAAKLIGEMPHPVYPEFLRKNSVEGEVVVKFVVDVTGHPDMSTLEVVRTPHEAMTAAVRRVIQQMRFEPARIGGAGSPARTELVQISFVFQVDAK